MTALPPVTILLSTFQGEAFLDSLLQSLVAQSCQSWRLLVRDDGSSDGTPELLQRFRDRLPEKVRIIDDTRGNVGAVCSFALLLAAADTPYLMLCDQDDVWLPDKIEKTLERMLSLEATCGPALPLLVHTDLRVVDSDLRLLAPSFWNHAGLEPVPGVTTGRLLMQNCVTGATVMINRALRDAALPLPDDCPMHDWWLALVAACLGRVDAMPEQTVLYRQHGGNAVGAGRWPRQEAEKGLRAAVRGCLAVRSRQAEQLLGRFSGQLDPQCRELLAVVAGLSSDGFMAVRRHMMQYRLFTSDRLKNLLYLLFA